MRREDWLAVRPAAGSCPGCTWLDRPDVLLVKTGGSGSSDPARAMELAGRGATGGVWRAADELIRDVAVGVVHSELAKDRAAGWPTT
jgi:hypothetical protein